ncbi:hypothetical protein BaRGS_00037591 [Batillaria attramentaria]|uniref:Secreted protein n=1 Tax=Batillaria attramentaria TaxID=370345 RepID=A0ABD0J8M6_9CAEN
MRTFLLVCVYVQCSAQRTGFRRYHGDRLITSTSSTTASGHHHAVQYVAAFAMSELERQTGTIRCASSSVFAIFARHLIARQHTAVIRTSSTVSHHLIIAFCASRHGHFCREYLQSLQDPLYRCLVFPVLLREDLSFCTDYIFVAIFFFKLEIPTTVCKIVSTEDT